MNNKCKILHTADWHLGKRLEDFSRIEEQREVLNEICEIANRENPDVIVVAGDLFDTYNPSTEAIELFYKTLKTLALDGKRPVIAIAGNHDSPDRIEAPDPLARECGIIFAGYPHSIIPLFELDSGLKVIRSEAGYLELKLPDKDFPLRVLNTPYANEFRLKSFLGVEDNEEELRNVLEENWGNLANKYCDKKGVNILISHLFMVRKGDPLPAEPEDEKPILHVGGAQAIYTYNIPEQIQYTALGHLHRKRKVDDSPSPVYYSGSPLSYSFAEANQQKYVLMIETEPGETSIVREIPLTTPRSLLRKRANGIDEALQWLSENKNALVELTLVTDTFITAKDRKQLSNAHNGIVTIIPEVINAEYLLECKQSQVDLNKSMEELFTEFFIYEKKQEPNEDIMNLFKEILGEESD